MKKEVFAYACAAALCASHIAASANQITDYQATDLLQAPLGVTGMVHVRLPVGSVTRSDGATFGLSFGFGELNGVSSGGEYRTHEIAVAQLRLGSRGELQRVEAIGFDLAHFDHDQGFDGLVGEDNTIFIVVGLVAVGAAVALLASSNGDESSSNSPSFSYTYN